MELVISKALKMPFNTWGINHLLLTTQNKKAPNLRFKGGVFNFAVLLCFGGQNRS